jgi:hypothetical protein
MEHRVYQKQMNQKKLQAMLTRQKKDDEFFLEAVAKKKEMESAELRRKREGRAEVDTKEPTGSSSRKRLPKQKAAFVSKRAKVDNSLLDALAI